MEKKQDKPPRPVGRPKAPPTDVIRIRLPLKEHAQVIELGGDKWAKRVILENLEKSK